MMEKFKIEIKEMEEKIREEWSIKINRLKEINLDNNTLLNISKKLLVGEDGAKAR
jgi:hypothetical protein